MSAAPVVPARGPATRSAIRRRGEVDLKVRDGTEQDGTAERLGMACGAIIIAFLALMAIAAVVVVFVWIRSHIPV